MRKIFFQNHLKQTVIRIAKKAGKYLLQNFQKDLRLLHERGLAKEITTKYDKISDRIIIAELKKAFPSHNLLTEESGFLDRKSKYTWIVDSLDGSTNYARGIPYFAVSIALRQGKKLGGKLILGIIYAPFLKELYVAERGKGAFLNSRRIHVSTITTLSKLYVVSCEGGEKNNKRIARLNMLFHPQVKDLRKLGSAALEMAAVASGKADAYITTSMDVWDLAAGVLLVEEAGGIVTDFRGKSWPLKRSDVVATNGKVHAEILKRL